MEALTRRRACIAAVLAAAMSWAPVGRAAEPHAECQPLDETALRTLVSDAILQVDRGDEESQRTFVTVMTERLPCLTFAPRRRLLAQVFVLQAIEHYLAGTDWERPLEAAVWLHPRVDRLVSEHHDIYRYVVPDREVVDGPAIPAGVTLYVDGEPASRLPPTGEVHLVQVRQGDRWRSGLYVDEAVPERWMTGRIRPMKSWSWWGNVGLALGPGGVVQRPAWEVANVPAPSAVPRMTRLEAWPALVGRASLRYRAIGLFAELDGGLASFSRPAGSHAHAALVLGRGTVQAGGGAGIGGSFSLHATRETPGGVAQEYQLEATRLPYALGTIQHVGQRWDVGGTGGAGPSVVHASLTAGWAPHVYLDEMPLRLGLSAVLQHGRFRQDDVAWPCRDAPCEVRTVTWRAGVEAGVRTRPSR